MPKSLLEGMDMGSTGARAKAGSKKNESGKLIFALALLVIAGAVFAWSQGWILSSPNKPPEIPAEEKAAQDKAFQEQEQHTQEKVKQGVAKPGGTS